MPSGENRFSGRPAGHGLFQEMVHQRRDILDPFAKRRQAQRHHIQPIEQILAEQPLLHQMLKFWLVAAMMRTFAFTGRLAPTARYSPS